MADAEAVRVALDVTQINLVGASYGSRAVLDYLRLYPATVRRAVVDGAAPPDMVLPQSFSTDNQAALDALFAACAKDKTCNGAHPQLAARWRALLRSLPREVTVSHPVLGREERLTLNAEALLGLVRSPLYVPALASALPQAISDAAEGRFAPLLGLSSALQSGGGPQLFAGMHFSVVCAEDEPRREASADKPGVDFGQAFGQLYAQACADWPRGHVDPAFYTMPRSPAPVLVLSGGDDPATPPRHGARVAAALGPKVRHVVVPHAGHGVMTLPCLRDAVYRFVDAATDDAALAVDVACAAGVPRPPTFVPLAHPVGKAP
jgi:pimeloyl-ACP methyl ester carboxylesterase